MNVINASNIFNGSHIQRSRAIYNEIWFLQFDYNRAESHIKRRAIDKLIKSAKGRQRALNQNGGVVCPYEGVG